MMKLQTCPDIELSKLDRKSLCDLYSELSYFYRYNLDKYHSYNRFLSNPFFPKGVHRKKYFNRMYNGFKSCIKYSKSVKYDLRLLNRLISEHGSK